MSRTCPGCGGAAARTFGTKNGHQVVQCEVCGTLYCDCVAAPGDLYDHYYQHAHAPSFLNARHDQIARSFEAYRVSNRLLDVGFGDGSMLDAAARAGWRVEGVELSAGAVEQVRLRHPTVRQIALADAGFPAGHFDVVIASELLEHLDAPDEFLREVRRILRPGGLLWATTPHGRGLSARLLGLAWSVIAPPDHIQLFSIRGMRMLISRAGFQECRVHTHGIDPFEIARRLKTRLVRAQESAPVHRVNSLQPLNRVLIQTRSGGAAKRVVNALLDVSRLGDSLKVFARA